MGATLAYEVAHLLKQQNQEIGLLAMVDGWAVFSPEQFLEQPFKMLTQHFYPDLSPLLVDLAWQRMQLLLAHQPSKADVDMILFKAECLLEEYQRIDEPYNGWREFNKGNIMCYLISADHETIINEKNSAVIANYLQSYLVNLGCAIS